MQKKYKIHIKALAVLLITVLIAVGCAQDDIINSPKAQQEVNHSEYTLLKTGDRHLLELRSTLTNRREQLALGYKRGINYKNAQWHRATIKKHGHLEIIFVPIKASESTNTLTYLNYVKRTGATSKKSVSQKQFFVYEIDAQKNIKLYSLSKRLLAIKPIGEKFRDVTRNLQKSSDEPDNWEMGGELETVIITAYIPVEDPPWDPCPECTAGNINTDTNPYAGYPSCFYDPYGCGGPPNTNNNNTNNNTYNNNNEDEEKVDTSELKDKEKCAYDKLKKTNGNLFKQTIAEFDVDGSSYNLKFEYGTCSTGGEACTDASDLGNNNITIKIADTGLSVIEQIANFLHEGIHAEIYRYVHENGGNIDPNDRVNLYNHYKDYRVQSGSLDNTDIAQHQHMADRYVYPIARAMREVDGNRFPLSHYMGFGWDGLRAYGVDGYYNENLEWVFFDNNDNNFEEKKKNIINTTDVGKNCDK
ncbi:hypothetical protein [Algibacter sp. 2305UL17-15]|uniref:hypothetical protein n=1 Tax=Algibacter sp. 2305UL17-15 TaxID=3231268 RepID=UPI003458D951